jgi:hypothetical protein
MKSFPYSQLFFDKDNNIYNDSFEEIAKELKAGNDILLKTKTIDTFLGNFKLKQKFEPKFNRVEKQDTHYVLISQNKSVTEVDLLKDESVSPIVKEVVKESLNSKENAIKPNEKATPKGQKRTRKSSKKA